MTHERPIETKPAQTAADSDLVQRLSSQALTNSSPDVRRLDRLNELRAKNLEQDIDLRRQYSQWVLAGLGVQLAIADAAFFLYLVDAGKSMSPVVMDIWLSATVVQVVGIILVITRYLFPRREDVDT